MTFAWHNERSIKVCAYAYVHVRYGIAQWAREKWWADVQILNYNSCYDTTITLKHLTISERWKPNLNTQNARFHCRMIDKSSQAFNVGILALW